MIPQPLSVRNNNPGNMRGAGGAFQQFSSPEAGLGAMRHDLLLKIAGNSPVMQSKYGQGYQPTLRNLISTWAPPSENDTNNYINTVATQTGINPDQLLTPDHVNALMPAMTQMEGGKAASDYYNTVTTITPLSNEMDIPAPPDGFNLSEPPASTDTEIPPPPAGFDLSEPPQQEPSYLSRVGQAYADSVKPAAARLIAPFIGEQGRQDLQATGALPANKPETLAQSVNQGPIGAGSGLLYSMMAPIAPLLGDAVGYAANQVGATPSQLENVQAVMNIAGPAGMKGMGKALAGKNVPIPNLNNTALARMATDEATTSVPMNLGGKMRGNFVNNLIREKETPSFIRDNAEKYKSSGGILNKTEYVPDKRETAIAQTIGEIKGVKSGNTLPDNYDAIVKARDTEAQALKSALDEANVQILPKDMASMGQNIVDTILENPFASENRAAFEPILKQAQKAIDSNHKTVAGLLQARKDFDYAIKDFQPGALDGDAASKAFSFTAKLVRKNMNQLAEDSVPNIALKKSLTRQNHMYEALESMDTKMPDHLKKTGDRFSRIAESKAGKAVKFGAKAAAVTGGGTYLYNQFGGNP